MQNDLPKGFRAGAVAANFKKAGRDDLGLIVSNTPAVLAGMFTQNLFKAAPVLVCQEILARGRAVRAVLANAGQANACTGDEGLANCRATQAMVAGLARLGQDEILPLSTGVVGAHLKMDLWLDAVPALVQSLGTRDAEGFTRAFMTTDAFPKFASRDVTLAGGTVRLTVMAKGAGMICPNMATMLCVALTDAQVAAEPWQAMFGRAVSKTFNRVSVDGDTSTNDTILGLANGASGVAAQGAEDLALLEEALTAILGQVSYMLVKDGEGARKVIHITVSGAKDDADAERVARSVGHSQLVKTAIYGGDANWGRIVMAVGKAGEQADRDRLKIAFGGHVVAEKGQRAVKYNEATATKAVSGRDVEIAVDLGLGKGAARVWTCDLTHGYIDINGSYRS